MDSVVAHVKDIHVFRFSQFETMLSIVSADGEMFHESTIPEAKSSFPDHGRNVLVPHSEQQDVCVFHVQRAQSSFQAPAKQTNDTGVGLYDEDEAFSLRT